jgi:hypothetical protein
MASTTDKLIFKSGISLYQGLHPPFKGVKVSCPAEDPFGEKAHNAPLAQVLPRGL